MSHWTMARTLSAIAVMATALFLAPAASAQDLVVQRDVTIRANPSSQSRVVTYVEPGTELIVLDEGERQRGYYHVSLADGREGWVYQTFVTRSPAVTATSASEAIIHYIDVDQGAAALLEFPCGAVMIDAGGRNAGSSDYLIEYLEAFFARRTDLNRTLSVVFVTHTHIDHNRALRRVAETFQVLGYVHNGILSGSGRAGANWMVDHAQDFSPPIAVTPVTQSDIGPGGLSNAQIDPVACSGVDPRIRVLSASWAENPGWTDGDFENGNNHSLVIRVDYGSSSFLFTGDLEDGAIETLVERYDANNLLDTSVYAVGHHGSYNGTTTELLDAVSPDIAIISMGPSTVQAKWTAWAYGHPRKSLVQMLDAAISRRRSPQRDVLVATRTKTFANYPMRDAIYGTGWDGDIRIRARADGTLRVETSR